MGHAVSVGADRCLEETNMSTAALPGNFPSNSHRTQARPELGSLVLPATRCALPVAAVRRRANREQGRALEIVGHAIEYLVDSRLFITSGLDDRAEQEAVQMLMHFSRAVFAECEEIVPLRMRFSLWMQKRLHRHA